MTEQEQREFINEFIASVQAGLLAKMKRVPDNWDGIELRQWVADTFAGSTWVMNGSRKKEFNNDVLVNNL